MSLPKPRFVWFSRSSMDILTNSNRSQQIKCDGKLPACTHCINYKTDCVFTQVEKKRSPPKGYAYGSRCRASLEIYTDNQYNRAKYIEGLENRLQRMESLLRLSGMWANGYCFAGLRCALSGVREIEHRQYTHTHLVYAGLLTDLI